MAGFSASKKDHYDLSLAIANRRLAPAVRAGDPNVEIVASRISCRQQIEHVAGRKAKHLAEVLWESVKNL
jgi:Fe-S oxidoreductase